MSKTGNLQALAEFFQMQKVSTFNELTNKFACNERTIQRYLKELDSITSYTHSGHYITLAGVPRFDRNGIWFYKTIGFTKYKNSLELIVRLINSSRQGITRDELQEITGIQIFQQIQTLLIRQELHRVKLGNKYLYVPEEASKNKTKRFKIVGSRQIEEHHIKGVEINNLVAVLKIVLQEGQIEMRFLEQWIKKYSLTISFKQVKQLVEKYTLTEKKTLELLNKLRIKFQNDKPTFDSLSGLRIRLYPEKSSCLVCNRKTHLLKTDWKTCYSFELGKFTLISGSNFCEDHKYFSDKSNQIVKYQSGLATLIVNKGYRVTFDLLIKIGELRNQDHLQLKEIQTFLKCSSAKVNLPLSTVGMISKRYLELCRKLHTKYEDRIIKDIERNGGYVLHFDGSTEQKCGKVSFVLRDSLSGHVLVSVMIKSENRKAVQVLLEKVRDKYGNPLVILSDLRTWFVSVCQDVFGKKILHILCHYHFLRTFKDLFTNSHKYIQTYLIQTCKLSSCIQEQLNLLKPKNFVGVTSVKSKSFEEIKRYWADSNDTLGAYRYVLLWILKYKQDSSGKGVPFDLPYLDFFNRFMKGAKLIDVIFSDQQKTDPTTRLKFYYNGFCTVINKMKSAKNRGFELKVRQLEYSRKWFTRLRGALFMETAQEDRDTLAPLSKRYQLTHEEAKNIPKNIEQYLAVLDKELAHCKNKQRQAILIRLQKQTKKHHQNLIVPTLSVMIDGKTKMFISPRTNNFLESSFRTDKSHIRRQTGRSKVPREFGSVGDLMPYYNSMKTHKTFKPFFDNAKMLAEEFAKLSGDDSQIPDNKVKLSKMPVCAVSNLDKFSEFGS